MKYFLLITIVFCSTALGELVPAARLYGWNPGVNLGVTGGIDQYRDGGASARTIYSDGNSNGYTDALESLDNTGTDDCTSSVNSVISAAGSGTVVSFPPGTFSFDSSIVVNAVKNNITIRGAGIESTILNLRSSTAFGLHVGGEAYSGYVNASGTMTAGTTTLTLDDTTNFTVGKQAKIIVSDETDDSTVAAGTGPVLHVSGFDFSRHQQVRITAKDANTITFQPGLFWDATGKTVAANPVVFSPLRIGVEDLTLECVNGSVSFAVFAEVVDEMWFYNVKVNKPGNYGIYFYYSHRPEVRRCSIIGKSGVSTNAAGILSDGNVGLYVEDNIIQNWFPSIEVNFSTCGSVVSYNLMENENVGGYFAIDSNHGPHNSFNLYEGNIAPTLECDGFFGGASDDTLMRNWFHGARQDNAQLYDSSIILKRFTRNYNILGNILGKNGIIIGRIIYGDPNIGNTQSDGTAEPTNASDFWIDWKMTATLTTRSSDTTGVATLDSGSIRTGQEAANACRATWSGGSGAFTSIVVNDGTSVNGFDTIYTGGTFNFTINGTLPAESSTLAIFPGAQGYQEKDLDVENSTIDKGNYSYASGGGAGSMSSLGGDTLPDSYVHSSKPLWFNTLSWPPIDPVNPNDISYDDIPAGYRFLNGGSDPPTSPGTVTVTTFNVQ